MSDADSASQSVPKMDLMNFEDPDFEDSRYVLTSPRSLEACSRLGVKPVDLLYKPLAEFQEELLPQDIPLRTIYNIYDEHEKNRERKLTLAKEERERLMDEDQRNPPSKAPKHKPTVNASKKRSVCPAKTSNRKSKLSQKKELSKSDADLDKGSLQRKRTALATSVGHTRITNDEINNRVKELHEESVKLRTELLSRKEARAAQRKKEKDACRTASISRSYSASDLSLAGTSVLNKTNLADARPVTSKKLRKALGKSIDSAPVTPKDQKILELMMTKKEAEKSENRDRYLRALIWERQKKEQEAARLASELQRRRLLAEENQIKSKKRTLSDSRRRLDEERLVEEQERALIEKKKKWGTQYSIQQKMKESKLAEKMEKEMLKRKIQESNVKTLEKDEEEMKELVREKHNKQIFTAVQRKEAKLLEESMNKMMQNRNERRLFEARWNETLKDTQESLAALAESMALKDSQHKTKYEQMLMRHEQELRLKKLDREKKALQAKLAQQQQENEMEEWRDNLLTSREVADKHARETMAQTIERKARKAHEDRVRKENEQKKNIRKIHEEVEKWKKHTESVIEQKVRKSAVIQVEKENTINQSRQLAASSETLRSKLRDRYGGESFDQKVFKAEQYNKLHVGNTFLSSEKNSSQVKLH